MKKEATVALEIGMYNYSEEYYFNYQDKNEKYDPVFLNGLLFSNYLFRVYFETGNSVHSKTFADFLNVIKPEDMEVLAKEKKLVSAYNPEEASPDDFQFFLELNYSEDSHDFSFESQGNWIDEDLYKFDVVNSAIELISYLGKQNIHNKAFFVFLAEIANTTGNFIKNNEFAENDIKKVSSMITVLAYENFLRDVTFM